jgi:DNA repair protein RadC
MRITSYSVELNGKLNVLTKENGVNYKTIRLNQPEFIVEMMNEIFRLNSKAEEHVYILALDTKCNIIGVFLLSKGCVDASLISPRDIFVRLCLCGASCFVMCHNHPSGDTNPSNEDLNTTKRVKECAALMGVKLLDHIIVGDNYYSFKEHGIL